MPYYSNEMGNSPDICYDGKFRSIPSFTESIENMAKNACRTSLLKSDDYRLKGLPPSHRFLERCDLSALEDLITRAQHVILYSLLNILYLYFPIFAVW